MDDLNSRLEDPVDVLQFRPNIVTSANAGAYDEVRTGLGLMCFLVRLDVF